MNDTKVIRVGNSSGLRLTKYDKSRLGIKNGDILLKTISKDGNQITFTKPHTINKKTKDMINKIFKEDRKGIRALKEL